jgi:hypothetical protein
LWTSVLSNSPPLFSVLRVQFLTPIFFRTSSTDSSHLSLGFPRRRVPSSSSRVSFLWGSSSCVLKRCPSHFYLPIFITSSYYYVRLNQECCLKTHTHTHIYEGDSKSKGNF